ncbi:hypothetical protein [uncultured Desulfovibrio sp.]|nr:hypothetical protein [uncultured Desulfovibrio sp.]
MSVKAVCGGQGGGDLPPVKPVEDCCGGSLCGNIAAIRYVGSK